MWRQFQVSRNRPLASFRGLLQTLHHQRFIAALINHLHGNLFSTWKSGCHTLLFTCRAAARPRAWKARKPARTHLTGANGDHGDGELSLCSLCLLPLILPRSAFFAWFAVKRSFPKPEGKLFVAFVTFCKPYSP